MEVFDAELWAIGLALDVAIEKRKTLQVHGVKMVASVVNRPVRPEPGRNGAVFLRPDGDGRKGRLSTEKS